MNLVEFARWTIENGPFDGCDLDGGSVQEKAVACGILVPTKYDPKKHGGKSGAEPGDEWFVYSNEFAKRIKERHKEHTNLQ